MVALEILKPSGKMISNLPSAGTLFAIVNVAVVEPVAPATKLVVGVTDALDKAPAVIVTPEIELNVSIVLLLESEVVIVNVPVVPETPGFLILDKVKSVIAPAAVSVPPERVIVTT